MSPATGIDGIPGCGAIWYLSCGDTKFDGEEMFHVEHSEGKEMNITAGQKALEEIRKAVTVVLQALDAADADGVDDALGALIGDYQGTYFFNGHDGWRQALREPNEKPFEATDWF